MRKLFAFMAVFLLLASCAYSADRANNATDTETLGNDDFFVNSDGDLIPKTIGEQTLGNATHYLEEIYLNGVGKSEWGDIISPMTDATGYVYPTDSGGVFRMYDTGYLSLGAGTAVDVYVLFDTDDDDWIIGRDDSDNDFSINVGSTLGTDERISITDDATATIVVIGDGVNSEDKQITFDGDALDYYIAYDDSSDDLVMGVGSTVGTSLCIAIQNESSPLLYVHNGIDAVGDVDLDIGSADVDDVTIITDGGTIVIDGTIALTNLDIISNATDDTIRVASEDAASTLEVFSDLSSGDAILKLSAGDGDAAGEQWTITSDQSSTDLVFGCDDVSTGDELTRFTISDAGVVTTMGTVNTVINDSANTTITDVLNITHSTSGTAAAGIGTSLTFDIENATGTIEEHASFDVVGAVATNGFEDTDFVINLMTNGALAEVFRIDMDNEADAAAVFELTSRTEETDGVMDIFELELDNTADTAGAGMGIGVSFLMDDGTDVVEQQASLDVVLTDATTTAENVDWIFSNNVIGTVREVLKIDTDCTADAGGQLEFTSYTIETNGVIDVLSLTLDNTADTATDNFGAGISILMEQEDSGTPIEQNSIDFVLTDGGTGAEDSVIRFNCMIAGVLDQVFEVDGDAGLIVGSGADIDYSITFDTDDKDGVITWMADEDNFTIDDEVLFSDVVTAEIINYAADTGEADGAGDSYAITLDPVPTAQAAGMIVTFLASDANAGACSLNVNSLGEAPILMLSDQTPAADYIEASSMVVVAFDGTSWQLMSPDCNP